jgi:hypothetical protein
MRSSSAPATIGTEEDRMIGTRPAAYGFRMIVLGIATVGVAIISVAATPAPMSTGQQDQTAEVVLNRGPAPYFYQDDRFAGKVVHWMQVSRSYTPGSPSSWNGQDVVGEIWVQFDHAGTPQVFAGVYTTRDGTFVQAQYISRASGMVAFGEESAGPRSGQPQCAAMSSSGPSLLRNVGPLFVDTEAVADAGFEGHDEVILDVASSPQWLDAYGIDSFSNTKTALSLERSETLSGGVDRHATIMIDPDSARFLGEHNIRTAPDGELLSEYYAVHGTLVLFDAPEIPQEAVSGAIERGHCND